LLTQIAAILLSIWTIVAIVIWALIRSVDEALLGRSPSAGDDLKFFAIPAVGWIFVIAAWLISEKPWRSGYLSDDHDDGVWIGKIYLPNRTDED